MEVIVVDNGSTDGTRLVVAQFAEGDPGCFQYIFEGRPGRSRALNAGIERARGEVVAFTDDDCLVDAGWIGAIATEFQNDAALAGLGGSVQLFNQSDYPVSIRTDGERAAIDSAKAAMYKLIGCNVAFRRRVLESVGAFDPVLGVGGRFGSAEDLDLFYRVYRTGEKLAYVPAVVLHHNHGRRAPGDVAHLNRAYIRGRGAFYCKHILSGDRAMGRAAYWEVRSRLSNIFARRNLNMEVRLLMSLLSGLAGRLVAGKA